MSKRRRNNEGAIIHRSDGRWEARVRLSDGKRKSYYAKTEKEALQKLKQAIRDIEVGLPVISENQTVEHYLTSWLDMVRHEIDGSSVIAYRYHMKRVIKSLGKVQLAKLTAQQIQAFYAAKLSEGLAPTTVHTMHGVLHHALKDAVRLGAIPRNVLEMVKPPRFEPKPKKALTEEQVHRLLEAAKGDWFEALFVVVLSTGMREGELFALQWEDIDFEKGVLYVQRGLQQAEKGYILDLPKSRSSQRTITLPQIAVQALLEHQKRQYHHREMLGESWDSTYDFVFPNQFGRHKIPSTFLARDFPRVLKRAGLPLPPNGVHFHDLRHTAATLLLANGAHIKVVSEMLGHSDVSITLRIYGHVLPNMQRDVADTMDKILKRMNGS
jgi:integrase